MAKPNLRNDPLIRYALELGFVVRPGGRHWHCIHPGGGQTILSYGRRRSVRNERNSMAALRRAAAGVALA